MIAITLFFFYWNSHHNVQRVMGWTYNMILKLRTLMDMKVKCMVTQYSNCERDICQKYIKSILFEFQVLCATISETFSLKDQYSIFRARNWNTPEAGATLMTNTLECQNWFKIDLKGDILQMTHVNVSLGHFEIVVMLRMCYNFVMSMKSKFLLE